MNWPPVWSVPEPELTLLLNPNGHIIGYTVGNDMSSRDIEGENPLYLPQAKIYDGSCALGPSVLIAEKPLPKSTAIALSITRKEAVIFSGRTTLAELKREPRELATYLFRAFDASITAFAMRCECQENARSPAALRLWRQDFRATTFVQ